jgi:hypothetical protein
MPAHDFLNMSEEELLTRADECLKRAGSALEVLPQNFDDFARLRLFLEAQSCLSEVLRRQAERTADQDRKRNEKIAKRDFWMEVVVMVLIGLEIILSVVGLWTGYEQGKVLDKQTTALMHMDTSTAATSDSLQKLVAAQDASLKILQQQQAELAKKPRFALYLGNLPIDKGPLHLPDVAAGQSQAIANLNLGLKNEGGVPASPSEIHILVPEGVFFNLTLIAMQELEPSKPGTRIFTYAVPLLPAGKTLRISGSVGAPKGHGSFKATFTVTTPQLQTVTPLGSLTVLPPRR